MGGKKTQHGSRHGEKFWEQEDNNVGMKMMKGMGWERGQGIGKDGAGEQEAIKVTKKSDRVGIGATDTSDGMYYSAMNDVFNNLLTKLNKNKKTENEGGPSVSAPAEKTESMQKTIQKTMQKKRLYSKFVKAKDVGGYTAEQKAAIFGTAGKQAKEEEVDEEEEDPDAVVKTSKMSMADYFKSKTAGLRRSPRLAAADPEGSCFAGLGMGFNLADDSQNATTTEKREVVYLHGNPGSSKKRKQPEPEAETALENSDGSKKTPMMKAIRRTLKAADDKSMKLKKLESAVIAEMLAKGKHSKKELKAQFSTALDALDEVCVDSNQVTLGKKNKNKKTKE